MEYLTEAKIDQIRNRINARLLTYESTGMTEGEFEHTLKEDIQEWFNDEDSTSWIFIGSQQFLLDYSDVSFGIVDFRSFEWVLSLGSLKIYSKKARR